ncbi:MAG: hypothetical protein FWD85_12280 [Microbacteriaceae bacterium]|nr:hypothetical protein [Microbacteriaceae bacterium]MCL2796068.1 hypothetical protein [Microbacteriaceae bacterium]
MTDETDDRGALLASARPWSLGVNVGAMPISASWPLARIAVYENGILVTALGRPTWIDRDDVLVVARSAGGIRVEWDGGVRTNAAFAMGLGRGRLIRALEAAGFVVR